MEKVVGIGGVFFRSTDPEKIGLWYKENLGIEVPPSKEGDVPWEQEGGPTVFAPFPKETGYFGDPARAWMINLRVRDLDAMVNQLRSAGIEVAIDPTPFPHGRFARLRDPEGNPIELWQPA